MRSQQESAVVDLIVLVVRAENIVEPLGRKPARQSELLAKARDTSYGSLRDEREGRGVNVPQLAYVEMNIVALGRQRHVVVQIVVRPDYALHRFVVRRVLEPRIDVCSAIIRGRKRIGQKRWIHPRRIGDCQAGSLVGLWLAAIEVAIQVERDLEAFDRSPIQQQPGGSAIGLTIGLIIAKIALLP